MTSLLSSRLAKNIEKRPRFYDQLVLANVGMTKLYVFSYRKALWKGFSGAVERVAGSEYSQIARALLSVAKRDFLESHAGVNVTKSSRMPKFAAAQREGIRVGNFGQDDDRIEEILESRISKPVAQKFNAPPQTKVRTFIKALIKKAEQTYGYRKEVLVLSTVIAVVALFVSSPSSLGSAAPYLVSTGARTLVKTQILDRYPVKGATFSAGIIVRILLLMGFAAAVLGLNTAQNDAHDMAEQYYDRSLLTAGVTSGLNVTGSMLLRVYNTFSMQKITLTSLGADVSLKPGETMKEAVANIVFYTGAPLSQVPTTVRTAFGAVAKVLNFLPWSSAAGTLSKSISESDKTFIDSILSSTFTEQVERAGVYEGYKRLENFYFNQNVLLMSQVFFSLILVYLFDPATWAASAGAAYANMKSELKQEYQKRTSFVIDVAKKIQENFVLKTLFIMALLSLIEYLSNSTFGQEKKNSSSSSTFHRLMSQELKKYKTKAKSQEEQRKRFALCSKRVSKQIKSKK